MASTKIGISAGNGGIIAPRPTDRFKVQGTDLGFLFEGGKQFGSNGRSLWVGGIFGDTFNSRQPGGADWRSPVILRTSNKDFVERGIKWDNAVGGDAYAKQAWPYRHIGDRGTVNGSNFDAFTIIPNDVIQLPDNNYLGCGFRVKKWGTAGEQLMCWTISNAWFWSNDPHAENWQPCRHENNLGRLYEWENSGRNHLFQNTTLLMVPGDDHVYAFGSPEGRKTGPTSGVYLRRAHWQHLCNDSAWEFWGWTGRRWEWGKNVNPTPILKPVTPNGAIGEINAQFIAGKVVLTYTDSLMGSVALTADRPDGLWSDPVQICSRIEQPAQYAPSVHPWSTDLTDAFFHVSSWIQVPNPLRPGQSTTIDYGAYGYRGSLVAEPTPQARTVSEDSELRGVNTAAMTEAEHEDYLRCCVEASKS